MTSADGKIKCGTTGTACGPVSYAWSDTAILTATPDAGNMFSTWAGDCIDGGNAFLVDGKYTCFLDTKTYGADKFAAAVFGEQGRTQHRNFSESRVHGPEFRDWIDMRNGVPNDSIPSGSAIPNDSNVFECTYCHGATYAGVGTAPSCTECHARNARPNWLQDCSFCHDAPPSNGLHPAVSSDTKTCWGCHQGTVDDQGVTSSFPVGAHMNGQIDATGGHAEGYDDPKIHGRDFFDAISSNPAQPYCTGCHGGNYERLIANGRSCNTCHAAPTTATPPGGGWSGTDWKSNCTFCHGTKTIAYAAPGDLNKAAPPDALSQRLTGTAAPDRTGAHAIHLTGSAFAGPMLCTSCHAVPATLTHISGRDVRAAVVVQGPGASGPEAGYQADGSCLTRCHGSNPSPVWTSTGILCEGCHQVPPASAIHAGFSSSNLMACAQCHPDTIMAPGIINVGGGAHVNGVVNRIDGHSSGFNLPVNHGPAYLDYVAGAPGALDCRSCHGASLDYCTSCHSQPVNGGWVSWQTNCTFCHGTKTPVFTPAELSLAAPPDAITQRLDGVERPTRTGQHALHLNDGGAVPAPFFPCDSCHDLAVPSHMSVARRATVIMDKAKAFPNLAPADLAKLPSPLGTFDPNTSSCTSYCHGSTMQGGVNQVMNWTNDFGCLAIDGCSPAYTQIVDCTDCHGFPPPTGSITVGHTYPTAPTNTRYCGAAGCANHLYHRQAQTALQWDSCAACHYGSAQGTFYNGLHVSGKPDIVFSGSVTTPTGTKTFTASWNATNRTCTATCHTQSGASTVQPW